MKASASGSYACHRQLLRCHVTDAQTHQSLGCLSRVLIDLTQHQVLGFSCRTERRDFNLSTYSLQQIRQIEAHNIALDLTVASHPVLTWGLNLDKSVVVGDCICLEAWSQRGKWLGTIVDYCFDLKTGNISDYYCSKVSCHASNQPEFRIASSTIVDTGSGWLLVSDPVPKAVEHKRIERWFPNQLPTAI